MLRTFLHAFIAFGSWLLFLYYWGLVLRQPVAPGLRIALSFLGTFILVLPILVVLWIKHNIRIGLHRNRRRRRLLIAEDLREDFLGRTVNHQDFHALQEAGEIVINMEGERKVYSAALPALRSLRRSGAA